MLDITELRITKDGDDLVEHWIFSAKPPKIAQDGGGNIELPAEIHTRMEEFYSQRVSPRAADYPLIGVLVSAEAKHFPTYALFGNMLEVRYVNALRNFVTEASE